MSAHSDLGNGGERAAAHYLEGLGYRILDRNFRCSAGEMDLVAEDGSTVVFCEVKTRRTARWGSPSEAVHARKQARLRRLGSIWLSQAKHRARTVRFDVISVVMQGERPVIEHFQDAF